MSKLLTRDRDKPLQEIRDDHSADKWRENVRAKNAWHSETAQERCKKSRKTKNATTKSWKKAEQLDTKRKFEQRSKTTRKKVEDSLQGTTGQVANLPSRQKWDVLGYSSQKTSWRKLPVVFSRNEEENKTVGATKGLQKILVECLDCLQSDEDKYRRRACRNFQFPYPHVHSNYSIFRILLCALFFRATNVVSGEALWGVCCCRGFKSLTAS